MRLTRTLTLLPLAAVFAYAMWLLYTGLSFSQIGLDAVKHDGLIGTGRLGRARVLSVQATTHTFTVPLFHTSSTTVWTFELRVRLPGEAPYVVQEVQDLEYVDQREVRAGAIVPVFVDRQNRNNVVVSSCFFAVKRDHC